MEKLAHNAPSGYGSRRREGAQAHQRNAEPNHGRGERKVYLPHMVPGQLEEPDRAGGRAGGQAEVLAPGQGTGRLVLDQCHGLEFRCRPPRSL